MPTDPPEPPHPLDAELRAQASRRRAELGAEIPGMSGPMRAQLQAEVARQFDGRRRPREERPGFLAWLFHWQRALATVAGAMLMIGLFAWNGGWLTPAIAPQAKQVVLNETSSVTAGGERAAPSTPAMDAVAKRSDAPVPARDFKEGEAKARAEAAAESPTDALAAGSVVAGRKSTAAAPAGAAAPAPAPVIAEPRFDTFAGKLEKSAGRAQNFSQRQAQVADRALKAAPSDERTSQLLNQFEFRQSGNRVEIVEADGSIYAGEIEIAKKDATKAKNPAKPAARAPATARGEKDKDQAPAEAQSTEIAGQFNFRASGVSNTLRQKVTIEGVYQAQVPPAQNAPGASANGGSVAQRAAESGRAQAQQAPSRARVIGRAQVNGRNVDVEAEATK